MMQTGNGRIPQPDDAISHQALVRLQSVYPTLKTAEKRAADYMITHPVDVSESPINEVAVRAGCSEATLVRLSRRMAYSGYPELRATIVRSNNEPAALYEGITQEDSAGELLRKVFHTSMQAIEDTLNILDVQQFEAATNMLHKAGKILLIGSGDASAIALTGFLKFSRLGKNAVYYEEFDRQLLAASQLKVGDAVLAVSHSGRTRTLVDVLKSSRENGACVIAICNSPVSPVTKNSDIQLLTATFAHNTLGEVMTKRIPELCIIESLYIALSLMDPQSAGTALARTERIMEINKL